ncbi:uncharacterized protein B0P05DRAFT_593650 [Gilbertella persicaria]|uniref:uncharacterized protein n=1 Tax=Gilbertella persicaria TaxID=101096 RepID=UPI002220151A|nr:uncharacterized protein B0P05DRAFT_593650 [Gilbertella persicaria]KAI8095056.1 hypothetical protein B0P05DRAFT_593650 [Gilbertella persicaria]
MSYRKAVQSSFCMDEGYTLPPRLASDAVQLLPPVVSSTERSAVDMPLDECLRLFRTVAQTTLINNIRHELNTKKRPNLNALIPRGLYAEMDTLGNLELQGSASRFTHDNNLLFTGTKGYQDFVEQNFDTIAQSIKDSTSEEEVSNEPVELIAEAAKTIFAQDIDFGSQSMQHRHRLATVKKKNIRLIVAERELSE